MTLNVEMDQMKSIQSMPSGTRSQLFLQFSKSNIFGNFAPCHPLSDLMLHPEAKNIPNKIQNGYCRLAVRLNFSRNLHFNPITGGVENIR